ncbi:Arabinanase/levansucrase/invertase [Mollisia scopiformis]|uniref:beta-fructofuranosidase n=1 Tax=Mollisia scopiformis TaxID=149040 RepID=A0A194WZT7_MOLSC|nr:Arabinanase/levansucrase/invertase [Mollisia scopiformis]KUJ13224.1 Arabinanase/levansucrase/invertase [Mollisia scopiformis]
MLTSTSLVSSIRRPSRDTAAADAIPILVDNEYHLFHLTTPPSTVHHPERLRSSWSHLRSKCLTQWQRNEEFALSPGKSPQSPDADGVWTGSAITGPDGNMHIFYTGYNLSENGKQVIIHATSEDRLGSRFTKSADPINITSDSSNRAAFEDIDFRDPYVLYNEEEKLYWMILGTRLASGSHWTRGCLALLTSKDLQAWTLEPDPFYAPNDMMCPECPELFSLPNGKWYLVYSRFTTPNAGIVYRVADSPRGPFRTPRDGSGGRLDGRRWYAAKSCPKAHDLSRRIFFGWIADQCVEDGKWSWGGDMAMPREVRAKEDGSLVISPVEATLDHVFSALPSFDIPKIELEAIGGTMTKILDKVKCERPYMITFDVVSSSAASFGLVFDVDSDLKGCYLRFVPTFNGRCTVSLAMAPAPLDDFWADQYQLYLPRAVDGPEIVKHENVEANKTVTILRSGDTLEVFVGGRSLSYRILASDAASRKGNGVVRDVGVFVEDGIVQYSDFRVTEGMDY